MISRREFWFLPPSPRIIFRTAMNLLTYHMQGWSDERSSENSEIREVSNISEIIESFRVARIRTHFVWKFLFKMMFVGPGNVEPKLLKIWWWCTMLYRYTNCFNRYHSTLKSSSHCGFFHHYIPAFRVSTDFDSLCGPLPCVFPSYISAYHRKTLYTLLLVLSSFL